MLLSNLFKGKNKEISFQVCKKEYDSPELNDLMSWFKNNGWVVQMKNWHVVGSLEIGIYEATKSKITIRLVFETYSGVMLFTSPEHEHLFSAIKINT